MSRFCGKCDFYDSINGKDEEYFKNTKIYIDGNLLDIKSEKDCIPYYAHIVGSFGGNKNGGVYNLTKYPWLRLERLRYGIMSFHYHYKQNLNEELIKNGFPPLYTEDECNENFWSNVDKLGPLFLKVTLFKDWKNNTYICEDKLNNKYLIRTLKETQGRYLIAKLEKKEFLDLLNNKTTMEQTFRNARKVFLTKYDLDKDSLNIRQKDPLKINKKHLPNPSVFLKDKADKNLIEEAIKLF